MANPTLLTMPLCRDADKNTIPATDAGTAGIFSEQYGWQAVNSLPLSAGGKAVQRQDFNGVFALLGGIAYACQRGYTFEWVATLPYLAGCVVKDPLDGNKYNALNDVPAGGTNPSLDPTNWELFGTDPNALTREITPAFNTRDVITTSGTYTAPVTGWYKITAKGGGGGGGAGWITASGSWGGCGGSEGGTTIAYEQMTAGETATVVIGGGGAGATTGGTYAPNGGNSSVTINGNTYVGGGGGGGAQTAGVVGTGTILGMAGIVGNTISGTGTDSLGGAGGGTGGGLPGANASANSGAGGGGGYARYNDIANAGGNGGDGFVWFEYFATI